MELFSLLGKIIINKNDAVKDIDDVTGKAEKSEPKIGGAMKKIGLAIGGAFAVGAIINFGKHMIETTANLQAMRAQFEQVFGADSVKAQEKINGQAAALGIHADRLTDSWNKFGAQTKGAGMNAQKSMEATEKATRLAADSAAFYDTNLETASASIASFMKGNFAAGDAIGVFTSAKQMDVKANEKYKKSWADLTEEERQYLLLDTIDKTYELNGAMGQAARESDSWANQTGNLKAAWNGFLEKIGTPVLAVAVKVVKSLSDGVMWLAEQAETYLVPVFNDMKDWFVRNWPKMKDAFMGAYDSIKPGFDKLIEIVRDTLTPIFEDLKDWFVENWPKIKDAVMDAYNEIKPAFDRLVEAVGEFLIPVVKDLWERFQTIWPGIQKLFETVFPIVVDLVTAVFDALTNMVDFVKGVYDKVKPGLDSVSEIFGTVFGKIADVIKAVKDGLQFAIDKLKEWNNTKMVSKNASITSSVHTSSSGATHSGTGRGFDVGSRFIPFDMETTVHRGEMIVPESENPYANSGGRIMPLLKPVPLSGDGSNGNRTDQANNRIISLLEQLVNKRTDIYLDKTKVGEELYDEFDDTMTRNVGTAEWELGGAY